MDITNRQSELLREMKESSRMLLNEVEVSQSIIDGFWVIIYLFVSEEFNAFSLNIYSVIFYSLA